MTVILPPESGPIMAIAAHPDDIESWCGGSLAIAADKGATVRLLLVTSGDQGSSDPGATRASVAATREAEAEVAARLLGIKEVAFLRYPDGEVENSRSLRAELVRRIRMWRPDVLFTHDPEHPWPPYLSHRDHREVGRAALDAAYPLARDRLAFEEHEREGLLPHAVRQLWLFSSSQPDTWVDISSGFERKVAARLAHTSQTPDAAALKESWRARARMIGEPVGLMLAEAFKLLRLD